MSSIVYLGTTPKASQAVSSNLRARGINLLKAAPCDIKALILTSAPPTYSIYKSNLAAYIRAAETGTHVLLSEPYLQFSNQSVPVFIPCTSIIFSFDTAPLPEIRDKIKAEFSAEDTTTRGKPALKAEMYLANVRSLVASYDPVQSTPGTSSSINLSAYKQFRLLHRLFDTFCRTQQYTFYDKQFNERAIELDSSSVVKVDHMATGGDENAWSQFFIARNPRMAAYCNLTTPHQSFEYLIRGSAQIPTDAEGLSFPYVADLSQDDFSTPITVVERYLKYCLGDSEDEVRDAFERLRCGWGTLAITPYGRELAHMFWCVGIAIESGGSLRVISSSSDAYHGCIVLGRFSLTIRNTTYASSKRETLVSDFGKASPHDTSLATIFSKIFYASPEDRAEAREACDSIHELREILQKQGTSEEGREVIRRLSFYVTFSSDKRPLIFTAFNIARVLEAIADPTIDETQFPLYPPAILMSDRTGRLWSAFGAMAPSFRVPAGKKMHLGESFQVVERGKEGAKIPRTVKKIGFVVKPFEEALTDLRSVIDDKTIFNPHGSSIMARSSSGALVKTVDGDQCERVVAALRRVASVTVSDKSGMAKGKRRADEDADDVINRKKKRVDDF